MKFLRSDQETPTLQMAPLIDIIFLMLIFFVTTSALESFEKDISIDLPQSDVPAMASTAPHTVYVEVDGAGCLKRESVPLKMKQLIERLSSLVRVAPDLNVVIRADAGTRWQTVVEVLEAASNAGVRNLLYSIKERVEMSEISK